jgi:hypothetical protein
VIQELLRHDRQIPLLDPAIADSMDADDCGTIVVL